MAPWDEEVEEKKPGESGEFCDVCGKKGFWLHLNKCPMCHKYFCDTCRYMFGGKDFCSRHCGNEFFWGGEDGDVEE